MRYAAKNRLRRNAELNKQRDKNRRKNGPFCQRPRRRKSKTKSSVDELEQQREGGDAGLPEPIRKRGGNDAGYVREIKVGMNWLIISSMKIRAGEPGKGFTNRCNHVFGPFESAVGHAERDAGNKETQHHNEKQTAHEGRVWPMMLPVSVSRSGAPAGGGQHYQAEHGEECQPRPLQTTCASRTGSISPAAGSVGLIPCVGRIILA